MGRKIYSQDLRQRVITSLEAGHSQGWVAATFQVSVSTIKRWLARYRAEGHVKTRARGHRAAAVAESEWAALEEQVRANQSATLAQQVTLWAERTGRRVGVITLWRAIRWLGWTRKKRQWVPKSKTL